MILIADPEYFLRRLKNYDLQKTHPRIIKKVKDEYMQHPDFTEAKTRNQSIGTWKLYNWSKNVI